MNGFIKKKSKSEFYFKKGGGGGGGARFSVFFTKNPNLKYNILGGGG